MRKIMILASLSLAPIMATAALAGPEKPTPEQAPSNFSISGRYILQPEIFDMLSAQRPGSGGEIQITAVDGAPADHAFYAVIFHITQGFNIGHVGQTAGGNDGNGQRLRQLDGGFDV